MRTDFFYVLEAIFEDFDVLKTKRYFAAPPVIITFPFASFTCP